MKSGFSDSREILPHKKRGQGVYLQIINSWGYQIDLFFPFLAKLVDTDRFRAEDMGLSLLQRTLKANAAEVEPNFTLEENPNRLKVVPLKVSQHSRKITHSFFNRSIT